MCPGVSKKEELRREAATTHSVRLVYGTDAMSTKDMRRKMLWPPKASELDDTQFKSVFREFTPEQQTRGQGSSLMMTREDRPLTPSSEARPLTPAGSEMSLGHSSSLVSSALSNRYPQNPAEAAAHAARREARKAAKLRNAFSQADRNQTNSLGMSKTGSDSARRL